MRGKLRLGLSVRGMMGDEIRMEGKWKLVVLEVGFRLGPGLGLEFEIAAGVNVGVRDWGVFGVVDA